MDFIPFILPCPIRITDIHIFNFRAMRIKKITTEDFLNNPVISEVKVKAGKFKLSGKQVSDIHDGPNNQYVDLVQEGGGVLGIALVGYTWAMEEAGIRFFSLAGTSAGAINTILMAAHGDISQPKALRILDEICEKNLFDFVDGNRHIKSIIRTALDKQIGWTLILSFFHLFGIIRTLVKHHGLNPGKSFQNWIEKTIENEGIHTTADLLELRSRIPEGFRHTGGENIDGLKPKLVIVASEITTQTKVHFPEMAELYYKNPQLVNPSEYVRASMSIPLFFDPYEVKDIPQGEEAVKLWNEKVKFYGKLPESVEFVDGGILSNFPINVFHNPDRVPRFPTFGVRLSSFREKINSTNKLKGYFGAIFNTMRHIYDFDFLLKNPDYSQLICRLDTDNDFNWLDFNIRDDKKIMLFQIGAAGAINFLENFNWEKYKEIRRELLPKL
jgi:NTE family protein